VVRAIGCGIDIEEFNRFGKHISFRDGVPAFLAMVFTEAEISRNRDHSPELTFPLGFSCKEAVFKAFGRSWTNSAISWKDIEVIFKGNGDIPDYEIRLGGVALEMFNGMGCRRLESSYEMGKKFIIFEVILVG